MALQVVLLLPLLVPLGADTAAMEVAKMWGVGSGGWGDPPGEKEEEEEEEEEGLPPPPSQGAVLKSSTRLMLPSTLGGEALVVAG